jgi:CubicO group peptidase (beta-lactamase class C family)
MARLNQTLFILLLSVAFANKAAVAQKNKAATIDSVMRHANKLGLFNGNILVVDGQKVIYKAAIGFTDTSQQIKLTEDYRFHIGSIAKEFNATAIMVLKDEGKLKLDDKVAQFLPELPAWAGKISVLNLLQYTSGLPEVNWKLVKSDADNMAELKKITTLDFEPGSKYHYNNNNTFLQRRIVEKVSGMPFNKFVEQRLLKPAKIKNAIIDPVDTDPMVAKAFNNDKKQDKLIYPISGWTALTLADFLRWSDAINTFKLITPASTRQILMADALNRQSGLGKGTMNGNQIITHVHDGTTMNYQALLTSDVPKGRTVILMTNNKQGNLYALNATLTNILNGKPYEMPKIAVLRAFRSSPADMSGEQILAFYHSLKESHLNDYNFNDEAALNDIGYLLLNKNKFADAIAVFEYNTRLFPNSGNVFDSLAEAYYKQGDKTKALLNYKKVAQLDPANKGAKALITELEKL